MLFFKFDKKGKLKFNSILVTKYIVYESRIFWFKFPRDGRTSSKCS